MQIDGPWRGDMAGAAAINPALGTAVDLLVEGRGLREPSMIDLRLGESIYPGVCPNCFAVKRVWAMQSPAVDLAYDAG